MKKNKKHIIILGILFIGLVSIDFFAPEPVDWNLYFNKGKKSPYGCYVLFDILENYFPEQQIEINTQSFYQSLDILPDNKNLILIGPELFLDNLDLKKMLRFVKKGNSVFISSSQFSNNFLDTLKLTIELEKITPPNLLANNPVKLNFKNPKIKSDTGFVYSKNIYNSYFSSFDTAYSTILGSNWNDNPNFIKIHYGKGSFFVHTQPLTFTNYHLLYSNYHYPSFALSYLPVQPTIWDEYYKPYKPQAASPLHVILSNKGLKLAYIVLMLSLLTYIFFMSKRRQRIIPIIKPPQNASLEFLNTISNLHQYQADYKDIAAKKFRYFLDFVESRYYLKYGGNTEEYIHKLALKSGVGKKKIERLFEFYHFLQSQPGIKKEMLASFNDKVEKFYKDAL